MVYLELLDIAWDEGGLLHDWVTTGAYVSQRIGISRRKFMACWMEVRGKFEENSRGIWSNPRLEHERSESDLLSEKQAKRAEKRWSVDAAALQAPQCLSQSHTQSQSHKKKTPPVSPGGEFDFESIYAAYPRKIGRTRGLKLCVSRVKTAKQYSDLERAVRNYAHTAADADEKFIKHFDTFMGCWEDYVDAGILTPRPKLARSNTAPLEPREAITEDATGTL